MWSNLLQDTRYGLRLLFKSPAFTAVAVATLALGIGLNTTLFTLFNAVALKPLPVRNGSTLMRFERWFASGRLGIAQYGFSWQEYLYLRSRSHSFPELIAVSQAVPVTAILPDTTDSGAERQSVRITGQLVTANYFSHLAVSPILGRAFAADENNVPGAHPVVVLSYPFWQTRLGGDPAVAGKTITLNGAPFTVIGVAPRDFIGTANPPVVPDFWAPAMMQAQLVPGQDWLNDAHDIEFQLLGHEVRVAAPPRGAAELSDLIRQFQAANPDPSIPANANPLNSGVAITTRISLQHVTLFGNTEDPRFQQLVALLMAIVGLVLLTACANLANMLLARATGRQREIGVRLALGASRGRLMRQLLTESVLLSLMGGAVGLVLSIWVGQLIWQAVTPFLGQVAFVIPTTPDIRVFVYTLALSILTGILFGLSPALNSSRANIVAAIGDSAGFMGLVRKRSRMRHLLIAGQVAISMTFLISAGLLARGLIRSQSAGPGFATNSVYLTPLVFGKDPVAANARARRVLDRVQALPEVESAGVVERPPMMWTWTIGLDAENTGAAVSLLNPLANYVSAEYFDTVQIPLVRGRNFSRAEQHVGAQVAILSEATARTLWPNQNPLGKSVRLVLDRTGKWIPFEVIGIARDVRTANLSRIDPAMVYLPEDDAHLANTWMVLRVRGEARPALSAIGAALRPVDERFTSGFSPLNLEQDVVHTQRLVASTLSVSAASLALLALLLAAVGIYGVASFVVSQREREVGIRMALGARAGDVVRLMVGDGMKPVLWGGLVGLVGASAVAIILKSTLQFSAAMDVLYGVNSFDPATFVGLGLLLGLISASACYVPARRAARVDPMVALRHE